MAFRLAQRGALQSNSCRHARYSTSSRTGSRTGGCGLGSPALTTVGAGGAVISSIFMERIAATVGGAGFTQSFWSLRDELWLQRLVHGLEPMLQEEFFLLRE